jgi:hypothetical protein
MDMGKLMWRGRYLGKVKNKIRESEEGAPGPLSGKFLALQSTKRVDP